MAPRRMVCRRPSWRSSRIGLFAGLVSLGFSALVLAAPPVSPVHSWKGGTGDWSDATRWSGGIPDGADADARVTDGSDFSSIVYLDRSRTVGRLTLDSTVYMLDRTTLTIKAGGFPGAGTLTGGTLEPAFYSSYQDMTSATLYADGDLLLNTICIGDNNESLSLTGTPGSVVTLLAHQVNFASLGGGQVDFVCPAGIFYEPNFAGGIIAPAHSFVQTATGSLAIEPDFGSVGSTSVELAGPGSYTFGGSVSVSVGANITLDAAAGLTNFDAASGTLRGGIFTTDGKLDLQRTVRINEANLGAGQRSTFSGLEGLAENRGQLRLGVDFTSPADFSNSGSMLVSGATFTCTGAFANSGDLTVSPSIYIAIPRDSIEQFTLATTLQLNAGLTQSGGRLSLQGGPAEDDSTVTVNSPNAPIVISGGRIQGGGTINGDLQVGGWMAEGDSTTPLQLNGNLTLTDSATTQFETSPPGLAGTGNSTPPTPPTPPTPLTVSGTVALAGNLRVLGVLAPGTSFTLLTAGGVLSGSFANVADGSRVVSADGSASFLVRYGALSPDPGAVVISDYQVAEPLHTHGPVPGQPASTSYVSFGPPAAGPFAGSFTNGRSVTRANFAPDGSVRVKVGDPAPGALAPVKITSLSDPSGDFARAGLALKKGSVTAQNDTVLLAGLADGPVRVAARSGDPIVNLPGATLASIVTFDGNGTVPFFLGALRGGPTGQALCAVLEDGIHVLVQPKQAVGATTVKTIATLVGTGSSLAAGRWRAGDSAFGARLSFQDGSSALYTIPATAMGPGDWIRWLGTGDALGMSQNGIVSGFYGLPSFTENGLATAVMLTADGTFITKANDLALVRLDAMGVHVLAHKGDDAGDIPSLRKVASFLTFEEIELGTGGAVAFRTKVNSSFEVPGNYLIDQFGAATETGSYQTVYTHATGVKAMAFPLGTGGPASILNLEYLPAFIDPEGLNSTPYTKTPAPIVQLLAHDHFGHTVTLQTGDHYKLNGQSRKITSFQALVPAAGSISAARGYDENGLTVLATFDNGLKGLVRLAIP